MVCMMFCDEDPCEGKVAQCVNGSCIVVEGEEDVGI
eukprot:CAMPEP_0183292100 /NCGR_PEP_ID=MMETSP0160_2-20130417/1290_1 /TAXON_ID=2839 ORGANISM="Odontella Sinensis, Strain Grunow 1884" /NCGR_SAMPLE_ID=MMETSP0160_2 /ASSEMBLY_ACC=CAM_ASM_000250 /LENGTH=35 /DNA_ID= /DNA_START= /DNA_END= /DNA_ORIENTATION=